ncbi:Ubiquitin-conjugating enzyme E2 4 [Cavenderia fasciculata]|uniref:Ubiquitin-conjugating enzyme E2 4 n=1 Tax=Cavenderia fasciculata TaxID=261658 RepID=F4QFT8_CACFS|nr:Ubiquitin-conjugating enzyme E2 4 [Cavenderia fasciculata]EGG14335.1 Ubiquitin-conjugating enzyme E2 4 [Cavenderia fasciculata]|eukprot:XP_004351044.1 Ubiquitin-conjugating enzyme E2 4 [Cavenderia fasciculata]
MPLFITIPSSNNKKIGVPFKPSQTVQELIKEVIKRASLVLDDYTLEYNASELYEEDTLEDLGIKDGIALFLRSKNDSTSVIAPTPTVVPDPITPSTTSSTTTTTSTDPNNNNNNIGNLGNLQINDTTSAGSPPPPLSQVDDGIRQLDVIVLDLSGSMQQPAYIGSRVPGELEMTRIEAAQATFQTFIDRFVSYRYPVAVGLVCFGQKIEATFPISSNFDSFSNELGEVEAHQSQTRLWEAIKRAAEVIVEFKKSPTLKLAPNVRSRIFCLTDGEDNGSTPVFTVFDYLRTHGIILDSIPIGQQGRATLSAFSKATGGTCFVANSSIECVQLFEREALLMLEHRDHSPFAIDVPNSAAFHALAGSYTQDVTSKVSVKLAPTTKCSSTVTTAQKTQAATGGSHFKRIMQEYVKFKQDMDESQDPPYHLFVNPNDMQVWKVIMKGPAATPYEGGHFILSVEFPDDYPFRPPKVRFINKIYHCNVSNDGALCLDILKDQWSPALTIKNVFVSISALLSCPNPDDPLDAVKAGVYRDDKVVYNRNAREWTNTHAGQTLIELMQANSLA